MPASSSKKVIIAALFWLLILSSPQRNWSRTGEVILPSSPGDKTSDGMRSDQMIQM